MDKARLEAFSDGVFAVAITLLALDLAVGGPHHGPLSHQLSQRWPVYSAYVVSFFSIGITWVNHHALLRSFTATDRTLLFLNLLLLLFVVAIPFGTSTVALYMRGGGADAHLAAALYAMILEGMALSFSGIFAWSIRPGKRIVPLAPGAARRALFRFGAGSLVYLAAVGLAFVNAEVAFVLIMLVAAYYVFEQTPTGDTAPERE